MRKNNYAYFISTKNEPRDNGSKILPKRNELPQFKNLCVGHSHQEFRRGLVPLSITNRIWIKKKFMWYIKKY